MINPVITSTPSPSQSTNGQKSADSNGFGAILSSQITEQTDKISAHETIPAPQVADNSTTNQPSNTPTASDTQTTTTTGTTATRHLSELLRNNQALTTGLKLATDKFVQDIPPPVTEASALIPLLPGAIKTTQIASTDTKTPKDKTLPVPDTSTLLANPNISVTSVIKTDITIDAKLQTKSSATLEPTSILNTSAQQTNNNPTTPSTDSKIPTTPVLTVDTQNVKTAELQTNLPSAQALTQTAGTLLASTLPPAVTGSSALNTISTPVGSNAWPTEFSQKISWISTQQSQVAELHLNPPDLGPMSVVLSVANNQATALFTSPHAEVRQAIENAMPQLRERLADNGIMLGNATVSDQAPRDSGTGNFTNQRNTTRMEMANLSANEASPLITTSTRRHNGILDTFA